MPASNKPPPPPTRKVFIRKMVTYSFNPILSVGSRNQLEIAFISYENLQLQVK